MKILIINYRFFISGGPERYLFNIINLLERDGHKIIPFSVKNNYNKESIYEKYFLSKIGKGDEVFAEEYSKTDINTLFKVISRQIYSFEAKRAIKKLIHFEKPDIVYILHYQNKISCSIIDAIYKLKIPIVHRVSDFGHICANNVFYLNSSNDICERCLIGSKINAIKNKCVKNSYLYSAIRVISLKTQELLNIHSKINYFIFPSLYTLEKYKEFGIPEQKCIQIPTFFNFIGKDTKDINYENFALYFGRIESFKGIMTLVQAFIDCEIKLFVIGFSSNGYEEKIKEFLKGKKHNISFLGKLNFDSIEKYLKNCLFTILPSECNDNMPNTLIESYAYKKAVIASDVPSLNEFIINGVTGTFFKKGDKESLKEKIKYFIENKSNCINMGKNGFELLKNRYNQDKHLKFLLTIFQKAIDEQKLSLKINKSV